MLYHTPWLQIALYRSEHAIHTDPDLPFEVQNILVPNYHFGTKYNMIKGHFDNILVSIVASSHKCSPSLNILYNVHSIQLNVSL